MADEDKQVYVQHFRMDCCGDLKRYRKGRKDFVPEVHGGKTVVIVVIGDTEYVGVALCSGKDQFCYKTGYKIALGRAMKQVPCTDCSC